MTHATTTYQSGDITVTVTRTGQDTYARKIAIGDQHAYASREQPVACPGRVDGPVQAALAAITSLRSILDSDTRERRTNCGTYGEIQDRFGDRSWHLWNLFCEISDMPPGPLGAICAAADAYDAAGEAAGEAMRYRDAEIRRAAQAGWPRKGIAEAARISRERFYQIIGRRT